MVKSGKIEEVIIYIEQQNGEINYKDEYDKTALMYAIENGNIECIEKLIEANADLNIQQKNIQAALMYAAESGSKECVEYLIDKIVEFSENNFNFENRSFTALGNIL